MGDKKEGTALQREWQVELRGVQRVMPLDKGTARVHTRLLNPLLPTILDLVHPCRLLDLEVEMVRPLSRPSQEQQACHLPRWQSSVKQQRNDRGCASRLDWKRLVDLVRAQQVQQAPHRVTAWRVQETMGPMSGDRALAECTSTRIMAVCQRMKTRQRVRQRFPQGIILSGDKVLDISIRATER